MTPGTHTGALILNVATLLAEPAGSVRDYQVDQVDIDLGEDAEARLARPADVTVRVTRTNRGLVVDGAVRASLAETCSRCLRPVEVETATEFEEEVLPSIDLTTGHLLDATVEPEIPRLNDHHELDLEPIVRDAILLEDPIAPLCRPDCPGLCAVCGADLTDGPHDHPDEPIDPRLEVLRRFGFDGDPKNA